MSIRGDSTGFPGKRDITDIANRMVPQGLLSIAAYLLERKHDVFVYDCLGPHAPINLQEQAREILACNPQIVGFSATTSSFPDAACLAQIIKEQSPDTITVCGGVHVSALDGILLRDYTDFDFLLPEKAKKRCWNLPKALNPPRLKA